MDTLGCSARRAAIRVLGKYADVFSLYCRRGLAFIVFSSLHDGRYVDRVGNRKSIYSTNQDSSYLVQAIEVPWKYASISISPAYEYRKYVKNNIVSF
jgi:hypothetical protein